MEKRFFSFVATVGLALAALPVTVECDSTQDLDTTPAVHERREVVYVDKAVEGYQALVADIDASVDVVLLDGHRDGIEQIARHGAVLGPFDAVHLITHGSAAELRLGTTQLTLDSMTGEYADELAVIGQALTDGADFLVYGCRFGEGELGRETATRLAELTGADIAASDDATGAEALGGDWDLEVTIGSIEAKMAVTAEVQARWSGLLDTTTVTTTTNAVDGDTSSVTALNVTPGPDGFISLREAIIAANTSNGVADTINLPAGTYPLIAGVDEDLAATGDLDITDTLTLTGAGAATTIVDGGGLDRVFDVLASGVLNLSDVTVQGGDARAGAVPEGGGIRSLGILRLTRVVVTGNFADNGGGLSHSTANTLTLTDVEISLNTATLDGGGFYADTPATGGTFSKVLFDTNTAGNQGGGAYLSGNSNSPFTNTTFSGNGATDAGGGIYHTGTVLTLMNVTMTGNSSATDGGGIYVNIGPRTTNVTNTILAGNTAPANPEMSGTIDSGSNNVIGDTTGLGALANNGGFTRTHAIDVTSPAYDGGTNTGAPTVDQRGYGRSDGTTDIGAYELGGGLPITARETIDSDADGQIDHIKITTDQPLNDNFGDLTMTVSGYTVTGYVTEIGAGGVNDKVFYVQLTESGTPDTGVRPTVLVTANTLLTDFGGSNAIAPDPPPESKIAFRTNRDGNFEIYVMDADGSNPVNLTNNAAVEYAPAWSPDGTKIAFRTDRDGNNEIYVMDADGSNQTRLTNNAAIDQGPAWSPDGSKIAFETDRDGNFEIYVMDADGSNPTRLTNNAAVEGQPDWSPDGSRIAFHSERDGNREIYLMDPDGSNPINLTNDGAGESNPSWSPDGSKIAFDSDRDGNKEIYVMDADGSNPTRLTNDAASDSPPAWSPDGSKIAFRSDRDGNTEIYVMDADGTNPINLTNHAASDNAQAWWQEPSTLAIDSAPPVLLAAPSTRPNGSYVFQVAGHQVDFVFSEVLSGAPSEAQLEAAWSFANGATDGDNLPSVGAGANPYTLATTSTLNDTIRVTFNAGNTANTGLLLVGTHTVQVSNGTNITDTAGNPAATAPAAVPITGTGTAAPVVNARETIDSDADGQIDHIKITTDQALNDNFGDLTITVSGYTVTGYLTEIGAGGDNDNVFYVQLTESGSPDTGVRPTVLVTANTLLTDFGGSDPVAPDPAPDGKIAFDSDRDGNFEIYVMDADGSNQTRLTNNAAQDFRPSWSSDGSQIVFDTDRDGNYEIYVMDADGSNPTRLTNNAAMDRGAVWSPDGSKIAFDSDRDGNREIYVIDADGSNPTRLTNDAAFDYAPEWSPDGSKIVFHSNRDGNYEIYVIDADGSNPINLTNNAADDWRSRWSPDGSKIAFDSDRDGNFEVYVMDADGSNPTRLTNDAAEDRGAAWSSDGSEIAFRTDRNGNPEIYLMEADGSNPINLTSNAATDESPSWWQAPSTLSTDSAPPVLLSAPSPNANGTLVFLGGGHLVDFVFSEVLSGVASEAGLESALTFASGATDGDNLPSISGGANPFMLATTTTSNDTIRVTFNAGNTANTGLLLVGTHTVQVSNGTNITDLAGNPASTAAVAVPITGTGTAAPAIALRETIDSDADGQIDHIKITTDQALNDNFGDVTITVSGYTVTGYVTEIGAGGVNDHVFYVQLTESGSPDTGVRPTVLVTANTLLTDFGGSNPVAPDPAPDSVIAFQTDRDGNYEIYVMDADGSNQINLTNNAAVETKPSWSPDGSQIVFDSDRDGNWEIYIMDADGSNPTNLTNNAADDQRPAWSPDGSKIAFGSDRDGSLDEIYVMNTDGSNPVRLTNNTDNDLAPSWSPDSSKIAFRSFRDGNGEIYVMDADGSNQINFTNNAADDGTPAWSPDGSKIAFRSMRDGDWEIYVMDADGSNPINLTNNAGYDSDPSWSPDGSQIAFRSDRGGNFEIYVMDADGTNPVNITNDPGADIAPDWWQDPNTLATDSAPPVLLAAPSNQLNGTQVFQLVGEQVDFIFSETLSGLPTEAELEAAWSFANGASDGDNLPSIGGGVNPFTLATTNTLNNTIRVTFNAGNATNTDLLLVGTHTVQVTDGTNITDLAGNPASTAAVAVPITGTVFAFYKPITIDRSMISVGSCGATLTNFPMLFSSTDPDLAHTTSGGDVTDPDGDDIIFRALDSTTCGGPSSCTLDHEIEKYVNTTGELVAWVRIPSLNTSAAASDTVIYIHYGNSTVTSPTENPTGVWDANYAGVWHLEEQVTDNTTGGTHDDSTSPANNGSQTNNGPFAGEIAGAQDFDGAGDFITVADDDSLSFDPDGPFSVSAWIFTDTASENIVVSKDSSAGGEWDLYVRNSGGVLALIVEDGDYANCIGRQTNAAFPTGSWHHVTGTYDGTGTSAGITLYIDGVQPATSDFSSGTYVAMDNTSTPVQIGTWDGGGTSHDMDGRIDEVRVSNTARTACWIGASYNNQAWPDKAVTPAPVPPNVSEGFYGVGAPTAVELVSFTAVGLDGAVDLSWETGSELDNLGFHLYRSLSEEGPYERITASLIPGLGSSPAGARYRYVDPGLANGVPYFYQLEDIETTGKTERHGPVSATPTVGGVSEGVGEPVDDEVSSSVITYGDPEANNLRVVKRGPYQVVLELTTEGFLAYPEPDGSVRIEIPDYLEVGESGLPQKQTWVEALAGRHVELVSIHERDVETFGLRPSGSEYEIVATPDGVVRLRRRVRPKVKQTGLKQVEESARLVSVAFQGEVKKALVEMAPLSWDASRQQLRLAKKLVVTLSFAKRNPDEVVSPDGRRGRLSRRRGKQNARGGVVARLGTTQPGLYAVRYEEIFGRPSRGRRVYVDAARLRLARLGQTVAYHLRPAASRFGPGSTLYFVSPGAEANPYGDEAVFELELGVAGGARMEVEDASPSGTVTRSYLRRDAHEQNRIYQAALFETDEHWMWDSLFAPAVKGYGFSVSGLAPGTDPARLELWLHGGSDFPESPDHHVVIYVNGTPVAEQSWDGKVPHVLDVELGSGVLREGDNLLEIENVGDTGAAYSMVFVDRYTVTYPRQTMAEDGRLEGRWTESGTAEITGLSSRAFLVDTTRAQPVWLAGASSSSFNVLRFRAEAEHDYLVVDEDQLLRPEVRKASATGLKRTSNRADYIVLGPEAFLEAARPLLEHRHRQGLTVRAVPIEQVYAEFGFGETRPEAIRDFLAYAYHHWAAPSLRYVLLLGDATHDFKNYYGLNVENHVPPLMLETRFLQTGSDPTYAAVNGDDRLPDLAIGRLPAANVEQVRVMVDKIVAYETGGASLETTIALVSDNPDGAGDFHSNAEELADTVLASRTPRHIALEQLGTAATRQAILQTFDEGASVVSYIGHGGIDRWANESILQRSSVDQLGPQLQQPVVLTMNCLNGYFHFPFFDSLSEELVKAEGKGAIAAFSPSGLSLNGPAHLYHQAVLNELFHGDHLRLGDAVMAAQEAYAETGAYPELLSIYHLFGDPAMELR